MQFVDVLVPLFNFANPHFVHRCVHVLYGSQTGNAESVAKDLAEKLKREGINNFCSDLNTAKALNLKEVALCLVIVCSTTGNGDSPENASEWWRSIKIRSLVSIIKFHSSDILILPHCGCVGERYI